MNASEIRAKHEASKKQVINHDDWNLWVLCEIAAQLAELNETLKKSGDRSVFEAVFG